MQESDQFEQEKRAAGTAGRMESLNEKGASPLVRLLSAAVWFSELE